MEKTSKWSGVYPRLRTLCFLVAMIPVAVVVFIVSIMSLVIAFPWILYSIISGTVPDAHRRFPWHEKPSV